MDETISTLNEMEQTLLNLDSTPEADQIFLEVHNAIQGIIKYEIEGVSHETLNNLRGRINKLIKNC